MAKKSFSTSTVAVCLQVLLVLLSRDSFVVAITGTIQQQSFQDFLSAMLQPQPTSPPTDTSVQPTQQTSDPFGLPPTDPNAPLTQPITDPNAPQTSVIVDPSAQSTLWTDPNAQPTQNLDPNTLLTSQNTDPNVQPTQWTDPNVPLTSQNTDPNAQLLPQWADPNTGSIWSSDPTTSQLLGSSVPVAPVQALPTPAPSTASPVAAEVTTAAPVAPVNDITAFNLFQPTSGNIATSNTAPVSPTPKPASTSFTDQLANTFNMLPTGGNTLSAFNPTSFNLLGSMATTPAPSTNSFGMFGPPPQSTGLFGSLFNTFSQPKPAAAAATQDPFTLMKRILTVKKAAQLAKQSTNVAYHEQFGCVPAPVPCFKPQAQLMCNRAAVTAGGKPSVIPPSMMPPVMKEMYRTLEECLSPKTLKKHTMSPFSMLTGMMSPMNKPTYNNNNPSQSNILASPAASIPGQGPSLLEAATGTGGNSLPGGSLSGGSLFGPGSSSFMSTQQPTAQPPVDCSMIGKMMLLKISASGEPMHGQEAMEAIGQMRKQFLPYTCQDVDVSSMPPAMKQLQYFMPTSSFPSMTLQYSMCCPGQVTPPTKMEKMLFQAEQGA